MLDKVNGTLTFAIHSKEWAISSVGSEHYLDKVGVTGSNPVSPTKSRSFVEIPGFLFSDSAEFDRVVAVTSKPALHTPLSAAIG